MCSKFNISQTQTRKFEGSKRIKQKETISKNTKSFRLSNCFIGRSSHFWVAEGGPLRGNTNVVPAGPQSVEPINFAPTTTATKHPYLFIEVNLLRNNPLLYQPVGFQVENNGATAEGLSVPTNIENVPTTTSTQTSDSEINQRHVDSYYRANSTMCPTNSTTTTIGAVPASSHLKVSTNSKNSTTSQQFDLDPQGIFSFEDYTKARRATNPFGFLTGLDLLGPKKGFPIRFLHDDFGYNQRTFESVGVNICGSTLPFKALSMVTSQISRI